MVRIASFIAAAAVVAGASAQKLATGVTIISKSMGAGAPVQALATQSNPGGANHQITVGGGTNLVYNPATINAAVGDTVEFIFLDKNHTATQSSFGTPCVALGGGADSDFMPNPAGSQDAAGHFKIQVDVTTPIWFYCRQTGHCGKGMGFSINPTAAKSQAAFIQNAIAQNGTAAAAAPAAASTTAAGAASPPAAAAPAVSTAAGTNPVTADGTTSCQCLCGTNAFAVQGSFGGLGGMIMGSM